MQAIEGHAEVVPNHRDPADEPMIRFPIGAESVPKPRNDVVRAGRRDSFIEHDDPFYPDREPSSESRHHDVDWRVKEPGVTNTPSIFAGNDATAWTAIKMITTTKPNELD